MLSYCAIAPVLFLSLKCPITINVIIPCRICCILSSCPIVPVLFLSLKCPLTTGFFYLMLDMLCPVVLCYLHFPVPITEISYHCQCCYLFLYTFRAIVLFPISQTTQIKLKLKDCIFPGNSLYIHFKPQLFSTLSISNKVS